jgi:hypothetical protein
MANRVTALETRSDEHDDQLIVMELKQKSMEKTLIEIEVEQYENKISLKNMELNQEKDGKETFDHTKNTGRNAKNI